jgi:FAD:protein FMN transferase
MKRLFLFALCTTTCLTSCETRKYLSLSGKTMGTYYAIEYNGKTNFKEEIDSLLDGFIKAASTYDSTSEISEFNRKGYLTFRSGHLYKMLTIARAIHEQTNGTFEPTLMPLSSAYAQSRPALISNDKRDSLLTRVSFSYIAFDHQRMYATKAGVQIDLNAMGEGYAIDMLAGFLESKGIQDYKVEIGGEMKCKGRNTRNTSWRIGIENPALPDSPDKLLKTVVLTDEAISTSGSYRKFFTDKNGRRRSHILDPRSGDPVDNAMLSATVKSKTAVVADAMATACMVLGKDAAIEVIQNAGLEAFISYEKDGNVLTWHSKGFFGIAVDRSLMLR